VYWLIVPIHLLEAGLWSLIYIMPLHGSRATISRDHDAYKMNSMTFQILIVSSVLWTLHIFLEKEIMS
jgi:hypothetical protein